MKPFSNFARLNAAFVWLKQNAIGDCSVLVNLPYGVGVYIHTQSAPLWRNLYGPVEVR